MNKQNKIIRAQNISKAYKIYRRPFDRVKESLSFFNKTYHKEFYALDDVSFEVSKGESLGLIGRNGSGKSTLLKIIAGISQATSGQSNTKGRVSAILELTSNLKRELTGLENITLNLKMNGFNPQEIKTKIKEVEEFAEIGEFIHQPVKVYSSGMRSRLGFGIATSSEPDVLILDEVLAVGDFDFQQKCLAKINAMRDQMSMILVSHSMNSIRLFCDRVLVLEKGSLVFDGDPKDAVSYYLRNEEERKNTALQGSKPFDHTEKFYGKLFQNEEKITDVKFFWNKKIFSNNELMKLNFSFRLHFEPKNLVVGVPVWDGVGNIITGMSTDMRAVDVSISKDGTYSGVLELKNIFNPGKYIYVLSIYDGAEALFREVDEFSTINNEHRFFGHITPEHVWEINER